MTVKELIYKLEQVEDKTREVLLEYPVSYEYKGCIEEGTESIELQGVLDTDSREDVILF